MINRRRRKQYNQEKVRRDDTRRERNEKSISPPVRSRKLSRNFVPIRGHKVTLGTEYRETSRRDPLKGTRLIVHMSS